MAFIKAIPPGKAGGKTREVHEYMAEVAGHHLVAKIVQIFSTTKRMVDSFRQKGFDDLAVLDMAIAVADANMWARLYRLAGLKPELYYLNS